MKPGAKKSDAGIPLTGESRHRLLLEVMACSYAIFETNSTSGAYDLTEANGNFNELAGISAGRGLPLATVFQQSAGYLETVFRNAKPGGPKIEFERYFPDFHRRFSCIVYAIDDDHRALLISDMTETYTAARELEERNKELQCLYGITALTETPGIDIRGIIEGAVTMLPGAFRYPEKTGAMISAYDIVSSRGECLKAKEALRKPITVLGSVIGEIQIFLAPVGDDGEALSFFPEERMLVDSVAIRIGRIIERYVDENRIRDLTRDLIELQEKERQKLVYELHDGVIQTILVSKININEAMKGGEGDPHGRLVRGIELIDRAIADLRGICDAMYPSVLDDIGIEAAINWYGATWLEQNGIEFNRSFTITAPMGPEHRIDLFRISQELFSNVVKHSGADTVHFRLHYLDDGTISLEVSDNGLGFENQGSTGLGMKSINYRAGHIGCRVSVKSVSGEGTTVRLWGNRNDKTV